MFRTPTSGSGQSCLPALLCMPQLNVSGKPVTRLFTLLIVSILLASALTGQTPSIAVSAVSVTINPAATDSYTLQGNINGLSLAGASYVGLSVGNFGATIPLRSFTEQAGTNVFTYQDTTGLAPYWVSSLTIDLNAHTFKAQANKIVLAGLTNPFAVKLGTDQNAACTMVRVQQASPGSYQLTAVDPEGMTCEISNTPVALPDVLVAGTATSVTVDVTAVQITANDTPQNVQLFSADDNAQPTGAALCTLSLQPGGDYACTVSFNQSNPGMIPLLLQATVSGRQILAPGFALQVAATPTNDNAQQILNIETAMVQAWQNFVQYGDSAYARTQSLMVLRKLLAPPVALTGTPLGLSPDQESIYVRSSAGLPMVLPSTDVSDLLAGASNGQATNAVAANRRSISAPQAFVPADEAPPPPPGTPLLLGGIRDDELACNSPKRDIVQNNKVLVWSPGDLFFGIFNTYQDIVDVLKSSKCPAFSVNDTDYLGKNATVASLNQFANYGTIFIISHSGFDNQKGVLLTGEPAPNTPATLIALITTLTSGHPTELFSDLGIACTPEGCFKFVYATNENIHATSNTIIYASFCFSLQGGPLGFAAALAPSGSNSAYYGFIGNIKQDTTGTYGAPLFNALVNQYENTGDAYNDAIAGTGLAPVTLSSLSLGSNVPGGFFGIWNNLNLGYVGNPKLTITDQPPPTPGSQNLSAYLEGAASCGTNDAPYMNVNWVSRAKGGHLNWLTSLVSGKQDDFYDLASQTPPESTPGTLVSDFALAKWTPSALLPGNSDDIIADFYPDMSNPIAARACLTVHGTAGLFVQAQLAGIYDAANLQLQPAPQMLSSSKTPGLKITSAYKVPLQDACGCSSQGASAGVTFTPAGEGKWTVVVTVGAAGGASPGPYLGEASISLEAINPGQEGQAEVTVGVTINDNPVCVTASNGLTNCDFIDGQMMIGSQTTSLYDYTGPTTLTPVTLDTSTNPAFIYVGMNTSAEVPAAAVFSVTLNIQFVNQSSGTAAARPSPKL